MQDLVLPSCFSSPSQKSLAAASATTASPTLSSVAVTRSGQSVFSSVYRTNIAGHTHLLTVTWSKNLLLHALSISVTLHQPQQQPQLPPPTCKLELKPWYFWRKQGSKRFSSASLDIYWDLRSAKFHHVAGQTESPEPTSNYYVALVSHHQVVLLLGDMRNEAYRKTRCPPSLTDPLLLSRKEHLYGKKLFLTRASFHHRGTLHHFSIEIEYYYFSDSNSEPEMEIRMDGKVAVEVKRLRWKFRGNQCVQLSNHLKVEVYWDVHDWLFCPGLRHASFIFKPAVTPLSPSPSSAFSSSDSSVSGVTTSASSSSSSSSMGDGAIIGGTEFSLFLYAWRVD